MIHYILEDSIFLMINGESVTLSSKDPYFSKTKELLLNKSYPAVEELISKYNSNELNLEIKDGLFNFKGTEIPVFISSLFNTNKNRANSLLNFWLNMKKKHDHSKVYSISQDLIKRNFFPLTEDGFFIAYEEKDKSYTNSSLNNTGLDKEVFFYNIQSLPEPFFSMVKDNSIDEITKSIFGSNHKKILSLVKTKCFPKDSNHINYSFFMYGIALKNILNEENLVKFLETAPSQDLSVSRSNVLESYLKEIAIEKDGITVNQKKAMNFLKSIDWSSINTFVTLYETFKKNIDVKITALGLKNNFSEVYSYLLAECSKFKDSEIYSLDIESNFPKFLEIESQKIDNYTIIFPKTNLDLVEWTNKMGNCIHSYAKDVKKGECIVFALVDSSNSMVYNVEVVRGRVAQVEKVRKTPTCVKTRQAITKFLMEKNLIYKV